MRLWTCGLLAAALAAGLSGCGEPGAKQGPAPLAVSSDERLVVLHSEAQLSNTCWIDSLGITRAERRYFIG